MNTTHPDATNPTEAQIFGMIDQLMANCVIYGGNMSYEDTMEACSELIRRHTGVNIVTGPPPSPAPQPPSETDMDAE